MKKASDRRASLVARDYGGSLPFDFGDSPVVKSATKGNYQPCYKTHPPLELVNGLLIYGGSCHSPVVKDATVYVGLDYSMAYAHMAHPWEEGHAIHYPITDTKAPSDAQSFAAMVDWLAEQILAGSKVHAGCVGGHGRTGTLLAALVKVMRGEKAAIDYVRTHYCKKAVESDSQVTFLVKHFGIDKAEASKAHYDYPKSYPSKKGAKAKDGEFDSADYKVTTIKPMGFKKSIWGQEPPWVK